MMKVWLSEAWHSGGCQAFFVGGDDVFEV